MSITRVGEGRSPSPARETEGARQQKAAYSAQKSAIRAQGAAMYEDTQDIREFMLKEAPFPVGLIWQLTSPRSIQAFLVVLMSAVVAGLVISGQPVPDLIGYLLSGIVGFYFAADRREQDTQIHSQGVAERPAPKLPSSGLRD